MQEVIAQLASSQDENLQRVILESVTSITTKAPLPVVQISETTDKTVGKRSRGRPPLNPVDDPPVPTDDITGPDGSYDTYTKASQKSIRAPGEKRQRINTKRSFPTDPEMVTATSSSEDEQGEVYEDEEIRSSNSRDRGPIQPLSRAFYQGLVDPDIQDRIIRKRTGKLLHR